MIGTRISHYEVTALLGRGGMGEVYRAEDLTLGREVAIKVLPPHLTRDSERLERLRREARTLASIKHPNIATVFSLETAERSSTDQITFLVMELVEGRPLSELIPSSGYTLQQFFEIAVPLCAALATAHAKGIVHRDLKPANIMIEQDGQIKVLDFGLAKQVPAGSPTQLMTAAPTATMPTETRTVVGTLGYMSPEQIRGEEVDQRSDVFALGLVFHELLTGRRAFKAESAPDLISSILRDHPKPVDELRNDLPHHLGRVLGRCLEKKAHRRFTSAHDVLIELENLASEIETKEILADHSENSTEPASTKRSAPTSKLALAVLIVLLVAALAVIWLTGRDEAIETAIPDPAAIRSLAVLPFDNLMNDANEDYFVDGMHDALITNLSKLAELRVISRTSAMRYRNSDLPLPQIAKELHVDALIEGSVLRSGDRVRITAQLIDGRSDQHLWAESYDREVGAVLPLLSKVALEIVAEIEIKLSPEEEQRLERRRPTSPAAHEAFLKGRHFFSQFDAKGLRRAIEFYTEAIAEDPEYAEAYSGLAGCHLLLGGFGLADPLEQSALARKYSRQALRIDPNLSAAYSVLGWVKLYFDWDWPGAAADFERALQINPYEPYACHGYGDYLTVMGRPIEGFEQVKKASEVDPLSTLINAPVVAHALLARRYDEGIAKAEELLEIDSNFAGVPRFLAEAYWYKGELEKSIEAHRQRWKGHPDFLAALNRGYADNGPVGAMLEVARLTELKAEDGTIGPRRVAFYFALAGETDAAIRWLEIAYEKRVPQLMLMKQEPTWDLIRSDPRFEALTQKIGIP